METKRCSDFVEYIISNKSQELVRAFRDLWSVKTSPVPITKFIRVHTISYTYSNCGLWMKRRGHG